MAFAVTGSEIDTVSKKFKISAEDLQLQRNLYQKTTGSADNFDNAMTQLNKVTTSIAKGGGKAYLDALAQLGVSTTDSKPPRLRSEAIPPRLPPLKMKMNPNTIILCLIS